MSAFATEGVSAKLWHHAEDRTFTAVISEQVIEEWEEHEPRVIGFTVEQRMRILSLIRRVCKVASPPARIPKVCRDPDDDAILATAAASKADALVTHDKDLLVLGSLEGMEIVTPGALLKRLATRATS